jgi:hypothetical protein
MKDAVRMQVPLRDLIDESEFLSERLDPYLINYANFNDSELESISHVLIEFIFQPDEKRGQESAD